MDILVQRVTGKSDVDTLIELINKASWDDANEIEDEYTSQDLIDYLVKEDTVFVAAYIDGSFCGMASARIEQKPYDSYLWLYIDEIDVTKDQRQKGVGTALMNELRVIAIENDCEEIWLGAEKDNPGANSFYMTLKPDEVADFTGYTFELEDSANE